MRKALIPNMLIITKISATILTVLLAAAPAQKMKQFPDDFFCLTSIHINVI